MRRTFSLLVFLISMKKMIKRGKIKKKPHRFLLISDQNNLMGVPLPVHKYGLPTLQFFPFLLLISLFIYLEDFFLIVFFLWLSHDVYNSSGFIMWTGSNNPCPSFRNRVHSMGQFTPLLGLRLINEYNTSLGSWVPKPWFGKPVWSRRCSNR